MTQRLTTSLSALLARLPGPPDTVWPEGVPFAEGFRHGSMSIEIFAPRGTDRQTPHAQDELYVIVSGKALFDHKGQVTEAVAGDVLFVPAGDAHCFLDMSADFATWVIFWGPQGGEKSADHD